MINPEKLTFKHLIMTIGNLPSSYVESLSYYECLLWLCNYIENTVIPTVNNNASTLEELQNLFVELKSYVDNYFDNLDVQEEINNKLDEMAEDGTLATLLTKYVITSDLNYNRIGRLIDNTSALDGLEHYRGLQGGALIDENTIAIISGHYDSSNQYADNNALIRKISLINGEVLSQNIVDIGHGNGFCYDSEKNKYYITSAKQNTGTDNYSHKIFILDSSFNIEDTIDTGDYNFDSICLDENNNLYAGVTYKGDATNGMKIFKLNKEDFSIEETISLNYPLSSIGTGQSFSVYNNYIYFLQYNPTAILVFDMQGNNIKNCNLRNNNMYLIGEVENINSLGDGNFIIGSDMSMSDYLYQYIQFFKINVFKNIVDNEKETPRYINKNIYVDNTFRFNPNGDETNAYNTLDEALIPDYKCNISIILDGSNTYYTPTIKNKDINIIGSTSAKISCGTYPRLRFYNSNVYFNQIAELPSMLLEINSNVKIYDSNLKPTTTYLINVNRNSVCDIEKCTFDVTADLDDYLFKNQHGTFIWNRNNQNPSSFADITKWFDGKIDVVEELKMKTGLTVSKSGTIHVNNDNLFSFKYVMLRFTDSNTVLVPIKSNTGYNYVFCNLSTGGTGSNAFYQVSVKITSSGSITYDKANKIAFNSSGTMSVDVNPDFKISDVSVY